MPTLSERLRAVSESATMIRGDRGFGRKPDRRALAKLAALGPVTVHNYNTTNDKTTLTTIQDVNPIIDNNVARYNSGDDGYTPSRDFKHVANIPLIEIEKLYQKGINMFSQNDWPKIVSMLDSSEWLKWRTSPGKIARKPLRRYLGALIRRPK